MKREGSRSEPGNKPPRGGIAEPESVTLPDAATIVERLASLYCSDVEIAYVLGIDLGTLYRGFLHDLDGGHLWAEFNLRRVQWRAAMNGDTAMLTMLAKNLLGHTDDGPPRPMTKEERRAARNAPIDDGRKKGEVQ